MLHELRLCRASALLLVVVALFSCLAPVLGARPDTGADAVRPEQSGLTTIPPPEKQLDMGSPMAPEPGGVTMVLPEAQIQEKGGPVPNDSQLELNVGAPGDLKQQNGPSTAGNRETLDLNEGQSGEPKPDAVWTIWINASCGGSAANLTLEIEGIGPIQTPYIAQWPEGTNITVNATPLSQSRGSCGQCTFHQWADGDTNSSKTLLVMGPNDMTAQFLDYYRVTRDTDPIGLTIDWNGVEHVTPYVSLERPGTYAAVATTPQQGPSPSERLIFLYWSDGLTTPARTVDVVDDCVNLTAFYGIDYMITISTEPQGLLVAYNSSPFAPAPVTFWAGNGTTSMLLTLSPQPPSPVDTRYRFDRWIGGPTTWGWNVTINGSQTYVARFITQYLITIASNVPGPMVGSDMPGCDVQMPAPLHCWVDKDSSPILIILTPQTFGGCRYVFIQWSDGDLRLVRPIGPVTGPATYVAIYSGQCKLTLQDTCTGNPPITDWIDVGTDVQLAGNSSTNLPPRTRYRFEMWIGDGPGNYTGSDPNGTITILGSITETSVCYLDFLVTVDTSPTGIDYDVDDSPHNGLSQFWWTNQSKHWLNLTVLDYDIGYVRYTFTHWSDGSTSSHHEVLIDTPEDFIAYYDIIQYKLTLSPLVIGDIRCVEHADCWYDSGEIATARVTSPWFDGGGSRYDFAQWSGDASGTDTSATLLMDAPKTAIAGWNVSFHLTVISLYGTPLCSNADCWYLSGTTATVTLVNPVVTGTGTRQMFTGWSVDASGMTIPLMLTMTAPKTVEASWVPQFLVIVISDCASMTDCGSPTGAGWYDGGTDATVSLSNVVNVDTGTHYVFIGWSGDASGTVNQTTVRVDGPLTITASWTTQFRLVVKSDCGGSVDCETPSGTDWYNDGSIASLTVDATFTDSSGTVWDFGGWTGDADGKNLAVTLTMDSPKTVTATWVARMPAQPTLPFVALAIAVPLILAAVLLSYWYFKRVKHGEVRKKAGEEDKEVESPTHEGGGKT
jgi:uncharacterized repeat protein (TIGR02543 family)